MTPGSMTLAWLDNFSFLFFSFFFFTFSFAVRELAF